MGDDGRPVLDAEGRAEMKYRETDTKTYRPSPKNLGATDAPSSLSAAPEASRLPQPAHVPPKPSRIPSPNERDQARKGGGEKSAPGSIIHVWTDGACSGNPGPMGIGIVVLVGDKRKEHGEYLGTGTNNIAELTAIQRGLEIAEQLSPDKLHPIRVYSDSSYAIGLLTQGWKAKANQALVAELRQLMSSYRNLRMVKVEGHAGVAENERCDVLARQAVARHRR
jgi:ribonuclease HI